MTRDIEESDEVLDDLEGDPLEFWEQKQRELLTSTVDYNIGTLADLVTDGTIRLEPGYQRRFRWDDSRQSLLIESLLMNVPVPPVFLNEDSYGSYSVIDGKQRLTAITEFLSDRLVLRGLNVFSDLNGRTFESLPTNLQSAFRTRPTLRGVIILRQSDGDVKNLVFHRLNTGGQTLNAQEIRNNAYPGPLNDRLIELASEPRFQQLLRIREKSKSLIYREMRDVEFVLRYLTFRDTWATFSGGMERHMDSFMLQHQTMADNELNVAAEAFKNAYARVDAALGQNAFQRWMPEREQWRQPVVAALFDAQMFALQGFPFAALAEHQAEIVSGMKGLFGVPAFRTAIDSATNTPSSFKARIELTRAMVDAAVAPHLL